MRLSHKRKIASKRQPASYLCKWLQSGNRRRHAWRAIAQRVTAVIQARAGLSWWQRTKARLAKWGAVCQKS